MSVGIRISFYDVPGLMNLLSNVDETVSRALQEDIGAGDLSAGLLPENIHSEADLIVRQCGILCGIPWFNSVFRQLDSDVKVQWYAKDGDVVSADQVLCTLQGRSRALLTGERTAINFVQTLSGTATVTREYTEVLAGSQTRLLDTRKTVPGLREAQKYAVRCGGGHNHRIGLFDGILLKENHIVAAGSIAEIIGRAKRDYPDITVEIEVTTLAELQQAIDAQADIVMLDNFTVADIQQAVAINNQRVKLEASGGFDKKTLTAVAHTGVDYVSVGALTKHIEVLDFSMQFTMKKC